MRRLLPSSIAADRLVVVVALLVLAACDREHARGARPNVLVISIDTLRADHLGCYGYHPYPDPVSPGIDELARASRRFESCFAPRGQTLPSLSSLMTGNFPSRHGVRENGQRFFDDQRTLAERLVEIGYETSGFFGFLPPSRLGNPSRGCGRVFTAWKGAARGGSQGAWDAAAEQECAAFLAERGRARGRPFFAWVHFYDVHQPYAPPAPFDRAFVGDYHGPLLLPVGASEDAFLARVEPHLKERMLARAPLDPEDARYVVALYDGGIRSTDERVGRLLQALQKSGLADDTIVVLTADHGEELGEHEGFWFHGNSVYDAVLHVPLLIRWPGRVRPGVSDALVQNVDVLPTLLALLEVRPPDDVDGISFARELTGSGPKGAKARDVVWSEWQDLIVGVRTREWKYLFNPTGAHPKHPPYYGVADDPGFHVGCEELYDLVHDRGETHDVHEQQRERAREMRRQAKDHQLRLGAMPPWQPGEEEHDADEQRELRRIGYVERRTGERQDVAWDPQGCTHAFDDDGVEPPSSNAKRDGK